MKLRCLFACLLLCGSLNSLGAPSPNAYGQDDSEYGQDDFEHDLLGLDSEMKQVGRVSDLQFADATCPDSSCRSPDNCCLLNPNCFPYAFFLAFSGAPGGLPVGCTAFLAVKALMKFFKTVHRARERSRKIAELSGPRSLEMEVTKPTDQDLAETEVAELTGQDSLKIDATGELHHRTDEARAANKMIRFYLENRGNAAFEQRWHMLRVNHSQACAVVVAASRNLDKNRQNSSGWFDSLQRPFCF